MADERPVSIQSDQVSALPDRVRAIGVIVPIGGTPGQMTQQVVSIADATGAILDSMQLDRDISRQTLQELREIRRLLAMALGSPDVLFAPTPTSVETEPNAF